MANALAAYCHPRSCDDRELQANPQNQQMKESQQRTIYKTSYLFVPLRDEAYNYTLDLMKKSKTCTKY